MRAAERAEAVCAWCRGCDREFYVVDDPASGCPYCGETDVEVRFSVSVRPH